MAELIYRTLRENIADIIRKRIIYQELEPGQKIVEQDLAKEFKTSRAPIREALRQLELEGLVNIIPNKGAYVTGISDKDVHDIYMIRSMLEGLCVRWATEHITQEQLEELDEIILLSEYHMDKGHSDQLTELDGRFHQRAGFWIMCFQIFTNMYSLQEGLPLRQKSVRSSRLVSITRS